jgi:hypothetical protein
MVDRIDQIDPQLSEMLMTLSDFQMFKEHMLSFKQLTLSKKKKSKKFEEYKTDQVLTNKLDKMVITTKEPKQNAPFEVGIIFLAIFI